MYNPSANRGDKMKQQKAIWSLRQAILIDLCSMMVTLCSTCIHIPTASVGAIQLLLGHMVSQVREVTQVNKKQPAGEQKGHTGFQSSSAQIQSRVVPAQEGKKGMERGYRDRAAGGDATVHQPNPGWGHDNHKGGINVWWYKQNTNHRIVCVGRNHKDHLLSSLLPLDQIAQSPIQPGLEHWQGCTISQGILWQSHHPHHKKFLFNI